VLAGAALLGIVGAGPALAAGGGSGSGGGDQFVQRNLISDIPGMASITDPNLVNPWGLAAGPTSPLWVADNGADVSTVYTGAVNGSRPSIAPLVVRIPGGAPTGVVFNPTRAFVVHGAKKSAPATFIFDSEAGRVTAWSAGVPPSTSARTVVNAHGAIFKGLAMASVPRHGPLLYATDFHNNRIDVYNGRFNPVRLSGSFTDRSLPAGYAPFNIQALGGSLYVTYAKQDANAEDDVAGAGFGFVDVYSPNGHLMKRLVSRGNLNAPWGLVVAPSGFGRFGGDLLVGNFGDGTVNAYNPRTGAFQGQLRTADGKAFQVDGLWGLRFGNGTFGTSQDLVFSAGINDESHGLLGTISTR
jgi:uncharacterized protein (TIGR03118 family)